jgi:membrane-associated protease RseP (regulator of RpoE activity)
MKLTRIHIFLFLATIITTFIAGYAQGGDYMGGLSFSMALIFILGSHEMGHYLYGRKYGVDITPPYFIPAPPLISPIGTFGAFIKIKSRITSKKALFDIGVAGPFFGIIAAIPVLYLGLSLSEIIVVSEYSDQMGITLGSSPIFSFFTMIIFGDLPEGRDILLHPVAFAGWIGLLVTALNLIPSGQLDGGHVIYSVFSRRVHSITSWAAIVILIILGAGTRPFYDLLLGVIPGIDIPDSILFNGWPGWLLWSVFLIFMGGKHPPTIYEEQDIGFRRKILAGVSMLIFAGCFSPFPVSLN